MSISIHTEAEGGNLKITCTCNSMAAKLSIIQSLLDSIEGQLEKTQEMDLGDHPSEERTRFEFASRIHDINSIASDLIDAMDLLPEEIKAIWYEMKEIWP